MSIKLSGDLYLTNVSPRLGDPVKTSILLFKSLNEFLTSLGLNKRYGKIAYVIVKGKTAIKCKNFVAFLSLEDTSKHFELKENLTNFHFDGQKIYININKDATEPLIKKNNHEKFKRNLDEYETIKQSSQTNKRKREESPEKYEPRQRVPNKTTDDDSNDSFISVISVKNEKTETNKINFEEQNHDLNAKLDELNKTILEQKQTIDEQRDHIFRLTKLNNENKSREFNLAIELAVVKQRNEDLIKEREGTINLLKGLNDHLSI